MDPYDEIKQIYFNATRTTIERDFARAIGLIKAMPDEQARERAVVYMEGIAQMRSEWAPGSGPRGAAGARPGQGKGGTNPRRDKFTPRR